MDYEYVKNYYGVPAEYGRIVKMGDKQGIIIEDRGHYIGVNFDHQKPGQVSNCHLMDVEYGEIGVPRKATRSQQRYQEYLRSDGLYESFHQFLHFAR